MSLEKAIISITSTEQRLHLAYETITHLRNISNHEIRFYINENVKEKKLNRFTGIQDLKIYKVLDLGPHTKFYYTLIDEKVPEDQTIIYLDDDVKYSDELIDKLYKLSKTSKTDTVYGSRGRMIRKHIFGNFKYYIFWENVKKKMIHKDILVLGVGAVATKRKYYQKMPKVDSEVLINTRNNDDLFFKFFLKQSVNTCIIADLFNNSVATNHNFGLQITNQIRSRGLIEKTYLYLLSFLNLKSKMPNDINWKYLNTAFLKSKTS